MTELFKNVFMIKREEYKLIWVLIFLGFEYLTDHLSYFIKYAHTQYFNMA